MDNNLILILVALATTLVAFIGVISWLLKVFGKAAGSRIVNKVEARWGVRGVVVLFIVVLCGICYAACVGGSIGTVIPWLPQVPTWVAPDPTTRPEPVRTATSSRQAADQLMDLLYADVPFRRMELEENSIATVAVVDPDPQVTAAIESQLGITITQRASSAALLQHCISAEVYRVEYTEHFRCSGDGYMGEVHLAKVGNWSAHKYCLQSHILHDTGTIKWTGGFIFILVERQEGGPMPDTYRTGDVLYAEQ